MTEYDYDLGSYRRMVTTDNQKAQSWFDRGQRWCYAYNHEEAVHCFQQVV